MTFSLFLSIYSRCGAPASWAARHTTVCLDVSSQTGNGTLTLITYHLRILGFLKCNISHASLQTKQVKFVHLFSSDSQSSCMVHEIIVRLYLLQCGLLCVGPTLELRFQGRLPMYQHCCSIFKWRTNEYSIQC